MKLKRNVEAMKRSRSFLLALLILVLLGTAGGSVLAQEDSGQIVGRVEDPTGAVIAGVRGAGEERRDKRGYVHGDQGDGRLPAGVPDSRHLQPDGGIHRLPEVHPGGAWRSASRTRCR